MDNNYCNLVDRECLLIGNSFASGLTSLRKANLHTKGFFYQAFFQLSIGLERLCKLTLILDKLLNSGKSTTIKELKSYGHNINDLIDQVLSKIPHETDEVMDLGQDNAIRHALINHLTKFAEDTRYYNLNNLSGENSKDEPLILWHNHVIIPALQKYIPPAKQEKFKIKINFMENIYKDFSLGWYEDIQSNLTTFNNYHYSSEIILRTAPYIVLEFVQITKPIVNFLIDLSRKIHSKMGIELPDINNYFIFNVLLEKEYILKHKRYKVNYSDS